MRRIFLIAVLVVGTAVNTLAQDGCIDCHGNRQRMEAAGYGGFYVNPQEVKEQTRMPATCAECHLGNAAALEPGAAHQGMARLLVVANRGLTTITSARRLPLQYDTNAVNRIGIAKLKDGKPVRDPGVAAISWHDKNRETLTQDFSVMQKSCGNCHEREFREFSRSTMGTNGKQSQYRGWLSERGPHNCGPWFAGNLETMRATTAVPISEQSSRINQKTCNACHVGCLDCHFNPQPRDPKDPARGPHSFVKTPPSESCYGNGRGTICHAGPEDRRRGAGYFGGSFSFPEGNEPDVHLQAKVGCLDCHESTRSAPNLGHGMVKRQAGDSCGRCHPEAVTSHAASRHRNLACEACHIQRVAGYQATYWGPGKVAGTPTPYFKFKAYYGYLPEPILIRDQAGRWIPVKPFPMAVMNQKTAPFKPGLHWRYPLDLPELKRTDDAWGYVGLFGGLPENNKALLWIQMDKLSHKIGKSRSCVSCHDTPDGAQIQQVTWEFGDPGALPFTGSHQVVADRTGLAIVGIRSEKIDLETSYTLSALAPWVYLKDAWKIAGNFALPPLPDRSVLQKFGADPEGARREKLLHR
ncbi:cytochrome c3 family protein [Geomesophilobacter sediminis]|uniref:Cytochrome C n=1 Tax=Geomesophilobacter sediminis TaxID=2798584 RepID=A0A8J7S825_9BACT|nr:cytochrome c3 family protein [Geomesophilobacter sediminis]MBJ6727391.1 cytochrome C [Geomesophilobacter sediminis]